MGQPLAYLLTWTTYGTWLHGDLRGSADRTHNRFATPYLPVNRSRHRFEREALKHQPFELDVRSRVIVDAIVRSHAEIRRWGLHAVNVRTNHVHVVLSCTCPPEKPLRELKAWATRGLREQRIVGPTDRVWTRHGSTRYLFDETSVSGAVRYVQERQ